MSSLIRLLLAVVALLLLTCAASAQQPLIYSAWYAVVYQPETDTLHWINMLGEQAQIQRPQLSDELEYLDLRIAPNGRTMVIVSRLNNGVEGLGVYDFATASFVATHQAQNGEKISLGGEQIFSADSQYFALGFFSGDFSSPAWRVLFFDVRSGNAVAFIDHTHPDAPKLPLSAPSVQYIDGAYVHFQLIPQSVGGWHTWPAYAWHVVGYDPTIPVLTESAFSRAAIQILPMTGEVVVPIADANYGSMPQDGPLPTFNSLATSVLSAGTPLTTVYTDATRTHLAARWAKGGDWILSLSDSLLGNRLWSIAQADGAPGNNSAIPLDPLVERVFGTSDGYLMLNAAASLSYTNDFSPATAQTIAQLTPNARVVYVTPIGISFTLDLVQNAGGPSVIVPPVNPPTIVPPVPADACANTIAMRLSVGGMGRVALNLSSLNVRQEPNGAILTTFATGTTFFVIGGPICADELYWWQIERFGAIGWVAEAVSGGYLTEPYAGPMSEDATPTPVVVAPPAGPVPPVCGTALPPRLDIGSPATILQSQLRPFNGPGGSAIPQRLYNAGTVVTVNAGPECAGGQFWWLVTGEARIGRIGQNTETVQGWIVESDSSSYFVAP